MNPELSPETSETESPALPRTETTTCILDCPDACALEVVVEASPEGERIRSIGGVADHPTTAGFICAKVSKFHHRINHADRLLAPMRRVGPKGEGVFEEISWEAALGEIVERFEEMRRRWGGESILPYHYGGSNGLLEDELLDHLFFARLGASRLDKTICAAPTTTIATEMYGKMPGVGYEDFEKARFILLWGANPKVSGIHLVPFIKKAKAAGAFVAVVDPVRNFSDQEVDLHLPAYPGTDLAVALSLIRFWEEEGLLDESFLAAHAVDTEPLLEAAWEWTFDKAAAESRVPAKDLQRLAEAYASATPAVLRCGWGVERNRNGGTAVAAILAMPALLGKFGVQGGGYTMSNTAGAKFPSKEVTGLPRWQSRVVNMTQLGEVLDPVALEEAGQVPVKGLFVYNCNPAATVPDQNTVLQGLAREDLFTVVAEQVMTDTARYADILLPATTFLEQREIRVGYGSYTVGGAKPLVKPRGQARTNSWIFSSLGQAMGFQDTAFRLGPKMLFEKAVEALELSGQPADLDTLADGRAQHYDFPGANPVQFDTVGPLTEDGKIHFLPPSLGEKDPFRLEPLESDYPLALLSPASKRFLNSTFGELVEDPMVVTLHPEDAAARKVNSGDVVRVFNELGEVHCPARISDRCRPGIVVIPKGAWAKHSKNGRTSTALCPATVQRVGGGACFSDARVEVELLPSS